MKPVYLLMMLVFSVNVIYAQDINRKKNFNVDQDGLALGGYDPVAYFKQNKAIKGSRSWAVLHQGITYYFSSVENKDAFKKNPSAYEPAYGGWCAYAMGKNGEKVDVDPQTFKIVDGKLYLFYNRFFNNTLKLWNKEEATLKSRADINWKKFLQSFN
jgi:YHS domain-containing protein